MAAQNKRILCFIDECGTAGEPGFALGCVMAWARECGRADKSLSDLLEPNANELHAANLSREYLQRVLPSCWQQIVIYWQRLDHAAISAV